MMHSATSDNRTSTSLHGRISTVQRVVIVRGGSEIPNGAEGVLEAGRYDVVLVESVGHAYSTIRQTQPDLVILCLNLDDLDGYQVLSMLKLDPATRDIPVVTYASDERREDTFEEPEDDEMSAPELFGRGMVEGRMN